MQELDNRQLFEISGGASWFSGAFFTSISRAIETVMNVGRSLGSAIRRAVSGTICPV